MEPKGARYESNVPNNPKPRHKDLCFEPLDRSNTTSLAPLLQISQSQDLSGNAIPSVLAECLATGHAGSD